MGSAAPAAVTPELAETVLRFARAAEDGQLKELKVPFFLQIFIDFFVFSWVFFRFFGCFPVFSSDFMP